MLTRYPRALVSTAAQMIITFVTMIILTAEVVATEMLVHSHRSVSAAVNGVATVTTQFAVLVDFAMQIVDQAMQSIILIGDGAARTTSTLAAALLSIPVLIVNGVSGPLAVTVLAVVVMAALKKFAPDVASYLDGLLGVPLGIAGIAYVVMKTKGKRRQ